MSDVVLDASAILAFLQGEPGANTVAPHLPGAAVSTVNLAEVASILSDRGTTREAWHQVLARLGLEIVSFTESMAYGSAALRRETRTLGLSLGDRACLSVAQELNLPVLTADRAWSKLTLDIEIRQIR